jgi:hypothetical protein
VTRLLRKLYRIRDKALDTLPAEMISTSGGSSETTSIKWLR